MLTSFFDGLTAHGVKEIKLVSEILQLIHAAVFTCCLGSGLPKIDYTLIMDHNGKKNYKKMAQQSLQK